MQPQQTALVSFPEKKIELDLALIKSLIGREHLKINLLLTIPTDKYHHKK